MDKRPSNMGRSRGRGFNTQQQDGGAVQGRGARRPGPQPVDQSANGAPAWGNQNNGNGNGNGNGGAPRGRAGASAPAAAQGRAAPLAARGAAMEPTPSQGRGVAQRPELAPTEALREENRGAVRGRRVISELIHSRPQNCTSKTGVTGTKVLVEANYFSIRKKPEWSIGQYRVDFSPDVDLMRVRRAYLAHHKQLLGGYIFDGTMLFTCTNLKEQMVDGVMELLTKNREGETIQIKIKYTGTVSASDATQIHVLNLILRRSMEGLNLQQLSRNFFDPKAKVCIDSFNLEIWPGYQTSIRQHEQNILLCVEIMHKVLRTDSVYGILKSCIRDSKDYQNAFKAEVIGMVVLTDYNNKTYRVDDVDFQSSPLTTFKQKDQETSFIDYYKQRYNIQVRDHKQPMLISRPTEKNIRGGEDQMILLIPELCRATGMTDAMRNNFRLMKAMSEHTRLRPDMRIQRLKVFNRRLKETAESMNVLKLWNMDLDTNLVQIPGRVLPPEKIIFGGGRRYNCDERADWTREFRNNAMFKHVDLKRWYVIVPRRFIKEIQDFVRMCIKAAGGMKMFIAEPRYLETPDDRTGSYSQAIENAVSNDVQMIMLALVSQDVERYSCIKKKCCVDRPVPSQVVTLRTVAPRGDKAGGLMSVATKVVIQMNAKIMGAPWSIELPLDGLMTVGFDVCHSAREKNKSFGAFVATMDIKTCSKYYSNVTKHDKGIELSQEISMSMTFALKAYRENHGKLPDRIMFFRDGVGDGQLHQVLQSEIKTLRDKLGEIYKSAGSPTPPRFSFIIVSKRINTRYFVRGQNPVPGTVVDDVITLPERYDFFLVSQSVRQGTVSPTNYNVIHDTMGLPPDRVQMLAYKMTHLYYNWSGTCRVPAVCQYAHKLAFLVSESIHRAPSNILENQLYFL